MSSRATSSAGQCPNTSSRNGSQNALPRRGGRSPPTAGVHSPAWNQPVRRRRRYLLDPPARAGLVKRTAESCGAQELQPTYSILSGGVTVLVDQTTENLPPLNRVRRAQPLSSAGVEPRALLQSAARSVCVVMRLVVGEHVRELLFAEDQHSIQALAANCADPPLGVGVGFRRALDYAALR